MISNYEYKIVSEIPISGSINYIDFSVGNADAVITATDKSILVLDVFNQLISEEIIVPLNYDDQDGGNEIFKFKMYLNYGRSGFRLEEMEVEIKNEKEKIYKPKCLSTTCVNTKCIFAAYDDNKIRFYTTTPTTTNEGGNFQELIRQYESSLELVGIYPKVQHVYGNLFFDMLKLKMESAKLKNGTTLTKKQVLQKEYENTPSHDKESRNRVLSMIFLELDLYQKETATINGKSYTGIELALLILDNDESNLLILDYIDDHLYITGEPSIKLLNGKDYKIAESKYGKLRLDENEPAKSLKIRKHINEFIQAVEYWVLSAKDYDSTVLLTYFRLLINTMHPWEKVDIFGMKMDKLEIVSKLLKDHPTLCFGYCSIAEIMSERGPPYSMVPGGKEFDLKDLLVMDLNNIHSNLPRLANQLSDINSESSKVFVGLYMYLIDRVTTLMRGFHSTIQIGGKPHSKLELISTMWEIKNSQPAFNPLLDNVGHLLSIYLQQTGQTFLTLKSGKILHYDHKSNTFNITSN